MIKRLKLTILSLLVSVGIFASETSVKNKQGVEIWYEFNTDTKWACVRRAPSKYSGNVIIPATVVYQGVEYSVVVIDNYAFNDCSNLTSVTIPESVTSIEWGTFCGCSSLTSVTIPEGVTMIGEDAFYNCTNITSITCKCIIPPMAKSAFGDFDTSIPLFVPEESIELYRNTNSWKKFTNIHPIPTDWTPLIIGAIVFAVVCVLIGLWIGKRKK